MIKIKIFPPKNVFSPKTLKPGYGPDSKSKIVSAVKVLKTIRPFCFEDYLTSRYSITSKTFFINHH